jgi:hypothetical protein
VTTSKSSPDVCEVRTSEYRLLWKFSEKLIPYGEWHHSKYLFGDYGVTLEFLSLWFLCPDDTPQKILMLDLIYHTRHYLCRCSCANRIKNMIITCQLWTKFANHSGWHWIAITRV